MTFFSLNKIKALAVLIFFFLFAWDFPRQIEKSDIKPEATPVIEKKDGENVQGTSSPFYVKVTRVIDGDTIVIEGGEKVRYIGMDTPETLNSGDCYSLNAKKKNEELVLSKVVRLEKDISERDKYGRLLRYVFAGDLFVNEVLVKEGYARALTYPPDVKYQGILLYAEKDARLNNKGLWAACNF